MGTMISEQRGERKKLSFIPKNVSSNWANIFLVGCTSGKLLKELCHCSQFYCIFRFAKVTENLAKLEL